KKYKDDPMPKHLPLAIGKEHFDRWLQLFNETIDELFEGKIAENARKRASSIARIMKAVKEIPQ
ncbi:MAG: group III truncated hemoglobin, partial [Daejeonella sp.]